MATGVTNVINVPKSDMQRPFSMLIAANDSSAKGKSMADYVCDGTEDDVQINAAITALSSGGEVHLLEGTYNISAAITMGNNITLSGCGNATILKLIASAGSVNVITGSNIHMCIKDMQIDGNSGNNSSGTQHGINFALGSSSNINIENMYIHHFRNNGINTSAYGYKLGNIHNNLIEYCVYGIYVTGGFGNICNNTVTNCSTMGIIHASDQGNSIHNNRLIANAKGAYGYVVRDNYVEGTGSEAVGIEGWIVINNYIVGYVIGITGTLNTWSGNRVVTCTKGLYPTGGSDTGVICGNSIYVSGTVNAFGISTWSGCIVSGNGVQTSSGQGDGIYLSSSLTSITGNSIHGFINAVYVSSTSCYYTQIQNNQFRACSVGVNNTAGCSNIRVIDNSLYSTPTISTGSILNTNGNVQYA